MRKRVFDSAFRRSFKNTRWMKQFGPRGTKAGRKLTGPESNLIRQTRSSAPNQGDRIHFFDLTIGKLIMKDEGPNKRMLPGGKIFEGLKRQYNHTIFNQAKSRYEKRKGVELGTRNLQEVPLNLALEFTFLKMPGRSFKGKKETANKEKIRKVINRLFRKGLISFEGKTAIDFSEELKEIETILDKKPAAAFAELFRKELRDETGWARHYIVSFIDPTIVLNRWN